MTAIRVVIADDHPMYRYGLTAVLSNVPGIELVGEAADGQQLLRIARDTRPDVVVTDLAMPHLGGAQATASLLAGQPDLAVLILTMYQDDESLFAAMRAGARGYLLKGSDRAELTAAIEAVARGEAVYGPGVAQRIIDFFASSRENYVARAFPSSPTANATSWTSWPEDRPTATSPAASASPRKPSGTTSRQSSSSCKSTTASQPRSRPAAPAWETPARLTRYDRTES